MNIAYRRIFFSFCLFIFLVFSGRSAYCEIDQTKKNDTYKELELFADALAFVQTQYVQETSPKDLIYGAMTGMLGSLDPHSQFMTPEEYDELKVDTEGKFGGVGIEITIKDDLITIITPIEGTPAWEAGMKPNDRIVKIDDTVIKDFTLNDAVKQLRGKPGTKVKIIVWREKEGKLYSFDITRAIIEIKDIKEARMLESNIGYIKLVEFREDTPQELDRSLENLHKAGMQALILDLRNNPGGLLDKAIDVSARFLPRGKDVVSIKGRAENQNSDFKTTFRNPLLDIPIVLLVNDGSASGSEIVAGAFQDYKRAVVLGTKTFGKGSVQTVLPLKDGSALKLTTSRYYTPLGRSIQDIGIEPDILVDEETVKLSEQDQKQKNIGEIFEKLESEKNAADKEQNLMELYSSDNQLARAVDLLKSIRIYEKLLKSSCNKNNNS